MHVVSHAEDSGDTGENGVLLLELAVERIGIKLGSYNAITNTVGGACPEQYQLLWGFDGSERRTNASRRLKIAVFARMPKANEKRATTVSMGGRRSARVP
jgi:hypothetical protein